MSYLVRLAYDDGEFKEGDHPRDKDGKFATGSGGGGSSAPVKYNVTNSLKGVMKVAGFTKTKTPTKIGNQELHTYVHPSGAKIIVHPPAPGQMFSSKFAVKTGEKETTGEGTAALNKIIQQAVAKAEEKKPSVTHEPPATALHEMGFKFDPYNSDLEGGFKIYKTDTGVVASFNVDTGDWVIADKDKELASGKSKATMNVALSLENVTKAVEKKTDGDVHLPPASALLDNHYIYQKQEGSVITYSDGIENIKVNIKTGGWAKQETTSGVLTHSGEDIKSLENVLKSASEMKGPSSNLQKAETMEKSLPGYGEGVVHKSEDGDIWKYTNGNKTVEFNPKDDTWLAVTPGHLTKTGKGIDNLKKLMAGETAVFKNNEYPWQNSSLSTMIKAPETAEQKAAKAAQLEKQKKAQEEHNKKIEESQKAEKGQHELKAKLKAVATKPTPSQKAGIKAYTGSHYRAINDALRYPDENSSDLKANKERISELNGYLMGNSFPEDCTLYRKVDGQYAKILKSIMHVGGKFYEPAFASCSTHESAWSGSVKFVISVKKGQVGASVVEHSAQGPNSSENEVVLPTMSGFMVTKIEGNIIHVSLDQNHHPL